MKQNLYFLIIILLMNSCSTNSSENKQSDINTTERDFKNIVEKLNILTLPLKIDATKIYGGDRVEFQLSDTIFFKENFSSYYGILEDTSTFYYIIPLFPGDILVPYIYVFDKKGKLIDYSRIISGNYGADCGLDSYCLTTITRDLKILSKDSAIQIPCDDEGIINNDSLEIFTKEYELEILKNGKIKNKKSIQ